MLCWKKEALAVEKKINMSTLSLNDQSDNKSEEGASNSLERRRHHQKV
jgi:hypothetical protein